MEPIEKWLFMATVRKWKCIFSLTKIFSFLSNVLAGTITREEYLSVVCKGMYAQLFHMDPVSELPLKLSGICIPLFLMGHVTSLMRSLDGFCAG